VSGRCRNLPPKRQNWDKEEPSDDVGASALFELYNHPVLSSGALTCLQQQDSTKYIACSIAQF